MVRAVVELPDGVHARLEEWARRRGVPLSDVLREAAERAADASIADAERRSDVTLPPARDLGAPRISERHWRELANEPGAAVERLAAEGRLDELGQP